jgi:hypothetical protein
MVHGPLTAVLLGLPGTQTVWCIELRWRPAGAVSLNAIRMIETWVSSGLFVQGF